jgi:hypothetical protein
MKKAREKYARKPLNPKAAITAVAEAFANNTITLLNRDL